MAKAVEWTKIVEGTHKSTDLCKAAQLKLPRLTLASSIMYQPFEMQVTN